MMFTRFLHPALLLFSTTCLMPADAFTPAASRGHKAAVGSSSTLVVRPMSSAPMNEKDKIGTTERLLLERAQRLDSGLVQEYGRTIKKDGLDGVRAAVWGLFHASQAVFSVLAVCLVIGMALNVAGYAYYFDDAGFHVESMQNLEQLRFFEAESARLAASAEQTVLMR